MATLRADLTHNSVYCVFNLLAAGSIREPESDGAGNVAGNMIGCRTAHLPVAWAVSRDNQVKASPMVPTKSSEYLDPHYFDCWPFRILAGKAMLRIPFKNKKKIVVNSKLHWYSRHRWILRASEFVSWFFQYNNLHHREKKGYFSNEDL